MGRCTMQDVFREHGASYAATHRLHPREARAAWAIAHCYTAACGSHWLRCPRGHFDVEQFHACGHRSCPRCADRPRRQWIDAELARLLPCPHFHVVFTLPHELLPLWAFNRAPMAQLLFDAARSSLLSLLADPRHLGALPGMLMSLHTWGRTLSYHPHVHCLVSAGGLDAAGQWRATRPGFLLPLKPLRKLFAGKLLAAISLALRERSLALPPSGTHHHWLATTARLYRAHWNIQINPPYASGRSVTLYLARYARGGPLPAQRTLSMHDGHVLFDYTDHRDRRAKTLRLQPHAFIERVLWHAPPPGMHTVRHAGLYASATVRRRANACIALALHQGLPPSDPAGTASATRLAPPTPRICPLCASPLKLCRTGPHGSPNQIHLLQSEPTSTAVHLGPTPRSSGPPTASAARPAPPIDHRLRARSAGCRRPLN